MGKLLLIIGLLVVAFLWWNSGRRTARRRDADAAQPQTQRMLSCAHCQVHLPERDALRGDDGRDYCCAEHSRAGPAPAAGP